MRKTWIVCLFVVLWPVVASSHGGGLDKSGGHYDRKTGEHHCHHSPCGAANSAPLATPSDSESTPKLRKSIPVVSSASPYDRSAWHHWIDADGNCINSRHEILISQADGPINRSPDGCYVSTGTWIDPYSGKVFHRTSEIDIDHVIPLKWAHDHGGASWSSDEKTLFANDFDNLLAVSKSLNKEKGAQGPDQWLPPDHGFRCPYLFLWDQVLKKYPALQMISAEQRVFERQLAACQ